MFALLRAVFVYFYEDIAIYAEKTPNNRYFDWTLD